MKNLFEEEQQTVEPTEGSPEVQANTEGTETESVSDSLSEPLAPANEVPQDGEGMANAMANAIPEDSSNPPEDDGNSPEDEQAETFPRAYVDKLRKEAAGYRERAKRADDLAQRLHAALVEGTGRLADARDLPFDESHLEDPQALQTAIEELLAERPHLASRRPMGNIGQGVAPVSNDVSLGGILRAGAM